MLTISICSDNTHTSPVQIVVVVVVVHFGYLYRCTCADFYRRITAIRVGSRFISTWWFTRWKKKKTRDFSRRVRTPQQFTASFCKRERERKKINVLLITRHLTWYYNVKIPVAAPFHRKYVFVIRIVFYYYCYCTFLTFFFFFFARRRTRKRFVIAGAGEEWPAQLPGHRARGGVILFFFFFFFLFVFLVPERQNEKYHFSHGQYSRRNPIIRAKFESRYHPETASSLKLFPVVNIVRPYYTL